MPDIIGVVNDAWEKNLQQINSTLQQLTATLQRIESILQQIEINTAAHKGKVK